MQHQPPQTSAVDELRELRRSIDRLDHRVSITNRYLARLEIYAIILGLIVVGWLGLWMLSGFLAAARDASNY